MDLVTAFRDNRAQEDSRCFGEQLYHYTSINSFFGIIKNKELWLGNAASMNDKAELRHFTQKLEKAVREDFPDKHHEINFLWSKIEEEIERNYPFVMSLSSCFDDAAQWERYANRATRVCLIIDTKAIVQMFYNHSGFLSKVFYEGDIRQHEHYKIIAEHFLNGGWRIFKNEDAWISNLALTAQSYKHKSFAQENEIRMIVFSQVIDFHSGDGVFRVEHECLNNQIRKVLKVDLEKMHNHEGVSLDSLFAGVMLGPKSPQQLNALKGFLKENGFNQLAENIYLSECPLR